MIKEDGNAGSGGSVASAGPSNAVNTGQVDMSAHKKLFKDLYKRTKAQREMDEHYINLFNEIMLQGK